MKGVHENKRRGVLQERWKISYIATSLFAIGLILLGSNPVAAQINQPQQSGWTYAESSTGQEIYIGANAMNWHFNPKGRSGSQFSDFGWGGTWGIRIAPKLSIENRIFLNGSEKQGDTEAELDGAFSSLLRLTFYRPSRLNIEFFLLGGFTAYNFELSDEDNKALFRPSVGAGGGMLLFPNTWLYGEAIMYSAGGKDDFYGFGTGIQFRFGGN